MPVLQHYPLYRVSDAGCTGLDAAPPEERHLLFREKYDVLSKESSQRVSALQSDHVTSAGHPKAFQPMKIQYNCQKKKKKNSPHVERADDDDVTERKPVSDGRCGLLCYFFSPPPQLLRWFKPRLILSGHTHSGCEVLHDNKYPEISVPSFSWRNRNNPSFILVSENSILHSRTGDNTNPV